MATANIRFEGAARPDGKVYFTSPDLPGFRLLLEQRGYDASLYADDLVSALQVFYPVYKTAEARRQMAEITIGRPLESDSSGKKMLRLFTSFGLASA